MPHRKAFLQANERYVANFKDGDLPLIPRRRAAIVTCMDCRIDPDRIMGLEIGDCHVIRNAGGRASDDAIRSLVISYKMLQTNSFFIIHHTDCGLASFDHATMRDLLASSLEPAVRTEDGWTDVGEGPGTVEGDYVNWLTFTDPQTALIEDVRRVRNHPLVPRRIPIHGMIYDVTTGKLITIDEADRIGRPTAEAPVVTNG